MTTIILIVICVLVIGNLLVWTFATAATFVKKNCQKNHYFWCDSGWECCNANNCAASKGEVGTKAVDSYKLTDRVYGTDSYYYQGCIQPMNSLLAALKPGEDVSSYNLSCTYCTKNSGGDYVLNNSNGGLPEACPACTVPNGFKYQGFTCSKSVGCPDSDFVISSGPNSGVNVLKGACTYLPFEDIPAAQNNATTGVGSDWLPFYPSGNTGIGYSQNGSGTLFAPGASNYGQYTAPTKWNYAPPSGGATLPTAKFSAFNRMNNTWSSLPSTNTTVFKNSNL
jgi:hypothetical protein